MQAPFSFTEPQRTLLDVLLAQPDRAVKAWVRWEALTDWRTQSIDQGSYRLLPLVYRRLFAIAPGDPALPLLKGVYRRSWYENTRQVQLALPALNALTQSGHPVMLLKGAALSIRYYRDRGARSFSDVDFLVPEQEAFAALELLEGLGWHGSDADKSARQVLAGSHAVNLEHSSGGRLDLHRSLLQQNVTPGIDQSVWQRAVPLVMESLPFLSLCPADELIQTYMHGILWNVIPSLRWVVDAVTLIRAAGSELDWDVFISQVRQRQAALLAARALAGLSAEFDLPIPWGVLETLNTGPYAWFEEAEARWVTANPGWLPETLYKRPFAYFRLAGRPGGLDWWLGMARYLLSFLKPPSWRNLPGWALRRWRDKRRKIADFDQQDRPSAGRAAR